MTRTAALIAFLLCLGLPHPGRAEVLQLSLPSSARLTAQEDTPQGSFDFPTGPFDTTLPTATAKGRITRQAWRLEGRGLTTLQMLAPLHQQLQDEGWQIEFTCNTDSCGGFDFRFAAGILPAPYMHVSLSDFRYLSAVSGPETDAERIGITISRAGSTGYIQITQAGKITDLPARIQVGRSASEAVTPAPADALEKPQGFAIPPDLAQDSSLTLGGALLAHGHAVLPDLSFETGSASLADGAYPALQSLAAFLAEDSTRRIAIVGHTDAVGSLSGNIALSKRRAASVLDRLAEAHGVNRDQMQAEGMGWLSPLSSNLTAEGRDANRRVEAVLLNTQ